MKCSVILLIGIVAILATAAKGKTFEFCGLARELKRLGAGRGEIPAWVCIAQHESSYRTATIGPPNTDGSRDHGLFQINDRYWCKDSAQYSHNGCNIYCAELRRDCIARTFQCAQQIKREQGYSAWSVWNRNCAGRLRSVDHCF